jgi:hypothetical protein
MKTIGAGVLLLTGAVLAYGQAAYIRETRGTVEVKAPGSSGWTAAVPGRALERASLLSTGFKSTALIVIGNSTVAVRPLTRLSVEEIAGNQNGERVVLNLRAGRVRAEVRPPAGGAVDFSVRSPAATASVRGTVFEFDGAEVKVEEGRVHLGGERLTGAYVGAGHAAAADPETGGAVTALERVKEELAPAFPAGVDAASVDAAPAAAPADGGMGIGFEW